VIKRFYVSLSLGTTIFFSVLGRGGVAGGGIGCYIDD